VRYNEVTELLVIRRKAADRLQSGSQLFSANLKEIGENCRKVPD